MSDYLDALADRRPLDEVLRHAYPEEHGRDPQLLPAVQAAPVYQPVPLPAPRRGLDPLSVRLLSGGGAVALAGLGVDLAGQGIRVAGPYLWALAGVLGALAAVIALLKSKASPGGGSTTIHIRGNKNTFGNIN